MFIHHLESLTKERLVNGVADEIELFEKPVDES